MNWILFSLFIMQFSDSNSAFEVFSKVSFLYFSWLELKYIEKYNVHKSSNIALKPISLNWFKKTSLYLKKGVFFYSNKKSIFLKRSKLIRLSSRFNIIQNAIYNVIFPYYFYYRFSFFCNVGF